LYEDLFAIASFSAMEKGVVVVAAAGNNGPEPYIISNGSPWVLTVTAGTIDRCFAGSLIFGNGETISGWSLFPGDTVLRNLPLVYKKAILSSCTSLELDDVKDKIIMCDSGNFSNQIDSIAKSNASGAIIVSDHARVRERRDVRRFPCPCIVISSKQAEVLLFYMENAASLNVTMNFKQTFCEDKACTDCGLLHFQRSIVELPRYLEARYNGTWVMGLGCLGSKHSSDPYRV
jgi:hypothetical protein